MLVVPVPPPVLVPQPLTIISIASSAALRFQSIFQHLTDTRQIVRNLYRLASFYQLAIP